MSLRANAEAMKFARINATSDGENTVIEGTAGKTIVVLGYAINVNAAGVVAFKDSTATRASFEFSDTGGASYAGGIDCPAFELAVGKDLIVENAAGVDTLGHLTYLLVS